LQVAAQLGAGYWSLVTLKSLTLTLTLTLNLTLTLSLTLARWLTLGIWKHWTSFHMMYTQ